MHIERYKHYDKYYLRLVSSKRMISKNGKPNSGKEVVLSIGAIDKYDDGKPNYLERLRASFREGKPLIKELQPYVGSAEKKKITITFEQGDKECLAVPKRMAACLLDRVFSELELDKLFANIKSTSKIKYDLQGIVRLLTYGRLLNPASKSATMKQNDEYYKPLVKSSNDDNVYDTLDVLSRSANQIFKRLNTSIENKVGKRGGTIFYDVTNFFFEIQDSDEDEMDGNGEVLAKGLRKMGVSKENRKQPIVQLGLFLDGNGIPVSFGMFPGNTLDHHTLRPAMKQTMDTLDIERFVLVADGGMYSGTNMYHVTNAGNGYIVSKSLKKTQASEVKWVLDPSGYTAKSNVFRYKSRIVERTITDENGAKHTIKEKVVVYWSEAFYKREKYENERFLNFIEELKAYPARFRITSAQSKNLRKFMKKDVFDTKSGEVLDGSKIVALIDDEKINKFKELMGYYQIVSSELEMSDDEIIEKYHGLTQIEDQFREMKGTLETRPVFVRTKEHIHAHLMICFIALTMMRLIQRKIMMLPEITEAKKDFKWCHGISGKRLTNALNNWTSNKFRGEYYQMTEPSNDLQLILKAFGTSIEPKIYEKRDILDMKAMIKVL